MARPVGLSTFEPRFPDIDSLDPERIRVSFDDLTDTLYVDFDAERRPLVSVTTGEHVYLRVDPDSNDVAGLMIEEFLLVVALAHPELLDMAVRAGALTPEQAADARKRIDPAVEKQAFLHSVLELATV